ncbi:sigma-70 family RNA polymerase sigma factor [Streptomyces sp. AM8-1-1]|uniref:sigma-70 family RNA polymerase sigma factor n=1 Tax=Streptomyces sp. AM8-1-1 TaxID=3075825 RepID=UPI0028C4E877|nr:sigma-70 family RNA polymerase sigma factor [Streptomyces sp. AM8-1-1]WNO70704.1 sigma-70 family RNA polymerase sigma factor [Streptomyces sp. AM8-1-1]
MSSDLEVSEIVAARSGDQQAQDRLVAAYLPLVHNIVGRALDGHADVDDVTQETMLRALSGLGTLRDPGSFRSWLVAITVNQIRGHWRRHREAPVTGGLDDAYDLADPGADFVDLTIARLGLSGQRREVAEATRWLDEDDRSLLSLWWLESTGELTRAEVAVAMELSPQHTAVRVQRMKAQLEASRVVVRALAAQPRCVLLESLVEGWDGAPSALWRKRIARHARECTVCSGFSAGLVPAERLLVGLALVPLAAAATTLAPAGADPALAAAHDRIPGGREIPGEHEPAGHHEIPMQHGRTALGHGGSRAHGRETQRRLDRARRRRRTSAAAVAVAALITAGGALHVFTDDQDPGTRTPSTVTEAQGVLPSTPPARTTATASPSPSPGSATPTPRPSPSPSKRAATRTPAPRPAVSDSARAPKPETETETQQSRSGPTGTVLSLVNKERAAAGCGPLSGNGRLDTAARRHSEDMAAKNYFSHTSQDGRSPGDRITAAGYQWRTYGENIARGQQSAASVMESWMNSPGHRANILNCAFTNMGLGLHEGPGGPWWTQVFGASS